ncbi:unnamed protein product, partial [Mesorhabditis belari]|uniref:Serpentine receptor class gamma n=1 Tax=Mesorhabditis belari TaxID=2138241 RepID=A0AAF3F8B2_9BILA
MYPTMFFVYLIYGTPTFILYLRAIYVICKQRKKFSSTFYTLYTNLLIVASRIVTIPGGQLVVQVFRNFQDVLTYIVNYPGVKCKRDSRVGAALCRNRDLISSISYHSMVYECRFHQQFLFDNSDSRESFHRNLVSLGISKRAAGSRVHEVSLFVIGVCSFLVQGICALVVDKVVSNTIKPDPTLANVITALNGDCMAFTEVYIGIACNQQLRRAILVVTHSGGGGSGQHKNSHHTNMLRSNSTPVADRIDRKVSGVHFSSILSEAGRVLFIVQKESYDIWQRLGIMTGCVLLIMWSAMFKKESKRAKGIIKLRNFSGLMKCWETYSGNFYSPVFIVAFGGLTLQVVCHRRAIACLDEKWPSAQKRKRWN